MTTLLTPRSRSPRTRMRWLVAAPLAVLLVAGGSLVQTGAGTAWANSTKSKVPLDTPVAGAAAFRPPSRGCDLTPASALVRTSTSTTSPRAPFALGHCRLLEIGDSLGDDLEYGLRHELKRTPGLKLIQRNKTSTGLSASWFYNWPAHLKSD